MFLDYVFYRRLVFVPGRIVLYNIFSDSSRGPDIFGTEPWHFYIRNLLLNFNAWFLLALCAGPLAFLSQLMSKTTSARELGRIIGLMTPFYLWLVIFSVQPHKEERFMYPMYPFLCLNAAFAMHAMIAFFRTSVSIPFMVSPKSKTILTRIALFIMAIIGFLRTAGNVTAYSAPLEVYQSLQGLHPEQLQGNLCVGKEWYRFPSSYFLPGSMRAKFIKSAFDGLLPGQFSESPTTYGLPPAWLVPAGMNDQNIEDPGKYVR